MTWIRAAAAYAVALAVAPAVAVAVACALCCGRRGFDRGVTPAVALAALLGALDARPALPALAAPRMAELRGWVESAPERDVRGGSWCWFRIERCDAGDSTAAGAPWRDQRLRMRARDRLPAYGTRIVARGTLRAGSPPRNFGAGDARAMLRAAGAVAEFDVTGWHAQAGGAGFAWRRELLEPLRRRLHAALESTLAPSEAGLLAALVLGRRDGIDPKLADAWSALGLTHVLSISGMHVALVAAALIACAGAPCRGRGLALLLAGLWTYAALGGLGPTVLRAAVMATWAACALYLGRARAPLVALGVASLGLVLHAPARRGDLGLQLSCLSTAGLLCWAPFLARCAARGAERGGVRRWLAAAMAVAGIGVAAQAATLPVVVWRFGVVSWIAPLANWIAVPCSDVALMLALLGAPLALVAESWGRPLLLVSGALLYGLARASTAMVGWGETRVFVPADAATIATATAVAVAACACGWAASAERWRAVRATAIAGAVALAAFAAAATWPRVPQWQVEALDVGQGDAVLLRSGDAAWLVDTGDARPADRGARVVVPHLRRSGVRRLRGVVLSHPHRDHCGGAAAVLGAVAADTVYVARASWDDSLYVRLRARAPRIPWRALARGDTVRAGGDLVLAVLWPPADADCARSANDCSLVLHARGHDLPDLWLMGDLEAAGEAQLLASADSALAVAARRYAILKAGHHGSDTSTTAAFVGALQPEVALLSVGAGNRYRHPGRRTLSTLAAQDCHVLRTDAGGAIRIVLRGATLWLERPASRRVALAAPG